MDKVKLKIDILKYKTTLFTTVLGSGIFLFINKSSILEVVNDMTFYLIVALLMIYGIAGYINNYTD